ncbi:hypothetical protein [Segetibacter sp. 3557_3]|uniref:hypothetical protein n=1 Tax=Segetibacter sp. 3557_3 TaxID=2547429 RepID=UPI0014047271|nr:hypothetical protein [Segetibacter sp. 3557_3]
MKKCSLAFLLMFLVLFSVQTAQAQCSICTKTAMQLGEQPAQGMNSGVIYLMFAPFAVMGYVGYRWWKHEYRPE